MTFRSIDMEHYLMVVPTDHAYETINEVAMLESAHFLDISDANHIASSKPYNKLLKRCEELLQSISMMNAALTASNLKPQFYDLGQKGYIQAQYQIWKDEAMQRGVHYSKLLDFYQTEIETSYERYHQTINRLEKLKQSEKHLLEKIACMETVDSFFGKNSNSFIRDSLRQNINLMGDEMGTSGISYIIGAIDPASEERFNKMIYRVSRGYACTRSLQSFKFEGLQNFTQKIVMVIYPNSSSSVLGRKLLKVLQTFSYSLSEHSIGQKLKQDSLDALTIEFKQLQNFIKMEQKQLLAFLQEISELECIEKWENFLIKEKYIYETLNKLEDRSQFMLANIYIPKDKVDELSIRLSHMKPSPTLQPISLGTPPTVFSTNSYTAIAQQITDTYGVPRYKEMNPSIFTCVTFPFFFGVMFGDIGHGLVLLALGLYLVFFDEAVKKSSLRAVSQLRYMVTMMGFFAFYCGWIYNDLIGFNINVFGSCYDPKTPALHSSEAVGGQLVPIYPKEGCVYPFGLDPIWGRAQNELVFQNNLKMKLAVIIGVVHMVVGICFKAANSLYFRKKVDFYFEFLPQIVFMVILFGYMDFLIIFKWLKVWDEKIGDVPPREWAPSIITTMMNIGLNMGKTTDKPDGSSSMWGPKGTSWQNQLQLAILFFAFICVPLMLLPKPLLEIQAMKRKRNPLMKKHVQDSFHEESELRQSLMSSGRYLIDDEDITGSMATGDLTSSMAAGEEHDEEPSEIFVHQLIETIEFVLGTVSNTASYLRLWALSLAHSQLAKVFFQKTMQTPLEMKEVYIVVPGVVVTFFMLCWITMGVLMCMDTMECFLHSLRLHWVQFQNKFYKGDGYRFQPLSIRAYLLDKKGY